MFQVDDESTLTPIVRTMQVIVFTMTSGLVVFLAIVLFVRVSPEPAPPRPDAGPARIPPLLTYVAVALAAIVVPIALIVPAVVVKKGRKRIARGTWAPGTWTPTTSATAAGTFPPGTAGDAARLAMVYLTALVLGAALTEAPAFFALIAYMLEDHPASLGLAVLLILGVAARFPTRERVGRWIDAQKEQLLMDRQAGV